MKHIVYMLIHLPCVWRVKIGITGRSSKERAKQVSRAMPGVAIPVGILFIPFLAHPVEQALHSLFQPLQTRFYRGDGSTEWFLILVAPVFYGFMWLHMVAWWWVLRLIFKTI
jgi:hypothetical protein